MSGKGFALTLLCFFIFLFVLFSMNKSEAMSYYKIQIGEEEVSYYVLESTEKKYIEDVIESKIENKQYVDRKLVEIGKKPFSLRISKYACTKENSEKIIDCKPFYKKNKLPPIKEIEEAPSTLQILFQDKVIYQSTYRENISEFLKEKGRYYFIVTYESKGKKKDKVTKLLFSVKVVE